MKKVLFLLLPIMAILLTPTWVVVKFYLEKMVSLIVPQMFETVWNNADTWYEEDATILVRK